MSAPTLSALGHEGSIDLEFHADHVEVVVDADRAATLPRPSAWCRLRGWRAVVKAAGDRAGALVLLVALSPLLIVVSVLVRASSPGPIFFRQRRVGRDGRLFPILKFRTMHVDAEALLAADPQLAQTHQSNDFKLSRHDDVRVTGIGAFLRRTSIDELPQLVNILRGHMSFVGPRPIVPEELVNYGELMLLYLAARPGLTGKWQVSGRNDVRYPERAVLDADYVENWSLLGDLAILTRTVPALLRQQGVS